jgi:signal transduction histidine kinase
MRFASSLTNRVFLACMLLAMLSLGFAFYFVNERASTAAEAELRRGLLEAGSLVDQHNGTRTDHFTRMARVVADLPKLKAAVETDDGPTVQPLADEYRAEVNADLLLLTGRNGQILGFAGPDSASAKSAFQAADFQSMDELSIFTPHARGVMQLVSVPILLDGSIPQILGRLTVGVFLDNRLATEFKGLTGSEIAFGAGGQILAATLPDAVRPSLAGVLTSTSVTTVTVGDEDYMAVARPLGALRADPDVPTALILRSRTERLQFLNAIRTALAGLLVVTLLLATILSYGVARTMTRPLAAITTAMRDVAATGDLSRKVPIRTRVWDDEDARTLAAAFNTLTESIARFQREAAHRDRLSSLGRMSTIIAHEIRNPLMIIRASLSTLRRGRLSPAEQREAIADIDEETKRLNRVVTDVLDFARPIRFECAEADLNRICCSSADAAWAGSGMPPVALDLDPSIPLVVTDAERLRTALVNILTNARLAVIPMRQARAVGGGAAAVVTLTEPAVRLHTRLEGPHVTISVSDRGEGISPQDMTQIFDPYFTTRRAGTGLGLPIAKNIIEGLGGSIAVFSQQGAGTEIRIELPLRSRGDV